MSNRLLAILVMISIIWFWYLYYKLEYLPYLQQKQLELQKQAEETQKQADPVLTKIEDNDTQTELTNAEKIEQLKEKNKNYKMFNLENSSNAYFKESQWTLDLYYNDNIVWNFNMVDSNELRVELINWDNWDLYIQIWKDKYFYDTTTWKVQKLDLNLDIIYAKQWTNLRMIFVTWEGSFIYSISKNSLEYFTYFNDFVYYKDWYIWVVKLDEKRILTNLWFEDIYDKAILVYYNPNTKEKKIVYSTDLDITKLYTENNNVYVKTGDDWIYKLENF